MKQILPLILSVPLLLMACDNAASEANDMTDADSAPSDLPWKAPLVAMKVNLPRGD